MAGVTGKIAASGRREKSAAAFRTISEVAAILDLPQHVLRFWETKFSSIQPLKRGGGRRYYRPEDLKLLQRIRDLLYSDGYTIKGVQKLLRQNAPKNTKSAISGAQEPALDGRKRAELKALLAELEEMRGILRKASG